MNGGAQQLYSDTAPINVGATATLSAVAKKSGMPDSSSVSSSYTITTTSGDTFVQGVAEDGATAQIWFAPAWTPTSMIAHSYVTGKDGVKGAQRDENMAYDGTLKRWNAPIISPVGTGSSISSMFTYSAPTGGNKDSAWYNYTICGDAAPASTACPSPVAKPVFSPADGVYDTQQSVSLSVPAASAAGTKIYYTISNLGTMFDFGEFNINRQRPTSSNPGIYVNTSRVDIFGFPLKLRVTGLDGYGATVGETLLETRDELFARFILETPVKFGGLAKAPYAPNRIMAPAHGTFNDGLNVTTGTQDKPRGENAAYLDAYITDRWNKYRNENLVLKVGEWAPFPATWPSSRRTAGTTPTTFTRPVNLPISSPSSGTGTASTGWRTGSRMTMWEGTARRFIRRRQCR